MKTRLLIVFCISVFFGSLTLKAQTQPNVIIAYGVILDGDTIPHFNLREVDVYATKLLSEQELKRYAKLIRNVKKTYPYAKLAGEKLANYNTILAGMKNDKARKEYMKKVEKEIEAQFGPDLKKLTFSQGKVLIKLIDRQTGNSSYDLVKELRGSFRAFFYQTFAKVFGFNLKTGYDPKNNSEDEVIERIIRSIELKQI